MLDRAKGALRLPGHQRHLVPTINAALQGFAEAESDGIIQVSTGAAPSSRPADREGHGRRCGRPCRVRARGRQELHVHVALHTDHCPPDKLDGFMRPLSASRRSASPRARSRCSSRTCGTAPRSTLEENLEISEELLDDVRRRPTSSSRSRSASSAARRTASPTRSTRSSTRRPRTCCGRSRRSASASAAATCSPRPSATSTASTSRATSSSSPHPQGGPGRRRREVRHGDEAVRPRLPRRLRARRSRRSARPSTTAS